VEDRTQPTIGETNDVDVLNTRAMKGGMIAIPTVRRAFCSALDNTKFN
jgi:hypothetical protein